jgi:hypothetical protein
MVINVNDYLRLSKEVSNEYADLVEKNKIYFHNVPEERFLKPVDIKIKVTPLQDPVVTLPDLQFLKEAVPNNKLQSVENIRKMLLDYITSNLNKYPNELDINNFLKAENLSFNISDFVDNDPFLTGNDIWKSIGQIKQMGGIEYFVKSLKKLEALHDEANTKLNKIQLALYVSIF